MFVNFSVSTNCLFWERIHDCGGRQKVYQDVSQVFFLEKVYQDVSQVFLVCSEKPHSLFEVHILQYICKLGTGHLKVSGGTGVVARFVW